MKLSRLSKSALFGAIAGLAFSGQAYGLFCPTVACYSVGGNAGPGSAVSEVAANSVSVSGSGAGGSFTAQANGMAGGTVFVTASGTNVSTSAEIDYGIRLVGPSTTNLIPVVIGATGKSYITGAPLPPNSPTAEAGAAFIVSDAFGNDVVHATTNAAPGHSGLGFGPLFNVSLKANELYLVDLQASVGCSSLCSGTALVDPSFTVTGPLAALYHFTGLIAPSAVSEPLSPVLLSLAFAPLIGRRIVKSRLRGI